MNKDETIGINLELPKDFSFQLDKLLQEYKESGSRTSKAALILKFAMMGYLQDRRMDEKYIKNESF